MFVAAFDADRLIEHIRHLLPPGSSVESLDAMRLPDALLTNRRHYLDPLNFATNFVFFRDAGRPSTRLGSANYWSGYGAGEVKLWLALFGEAGQVLARVARDPARWRGLHHASTAARSAALQAAANSPASCFSTRSASPATTW